MFGSDACSLRYNNANADLISAVVSWRKISSVAKCKSNWTSRTGQSIVAVIVSEVYRVTVQIMSIWFCVIDRRLPWYTQRELHQSSSDQQRAFGSGTDSYATVVAVGTTHQKSLTIRRFKDEIWQDCSSTKYASIDRVTFLMWPHTFKMAAWHHFTQKSVVFWLAHTQHLPGAYAAAFASSWSIGHS